MNIIADPHLIYTTGHSIKNKISWIRVSGDSEWIYFGDTDYINRELVISTIKNHFNNRILYIVTTRKKSVQTTTDGIETIINDLLMVDNFLIWDANFIRTIEFSNIGTMRCGQIEVQI